MSVYCKYSSYGGNSYRSLSKKLYHNCLDVVGSRNDFERDLNNKKHCRFQIGLKVLVLTKVVAKCFVCRVYCIVVSTQRQHSDISNRQMNSQENMRYLHRDIPVD